MQSIYFDVLDVYVFGIRLIDWLLELWSMMALLQVAFPHFSCVTTTDKMLYFQPLLTKQKLKNNFFNNIIIQIYERPSKKRSNFLTESLIGYSLQRVFWKGRGDSCHFTWLGYTQDGVWTRRTVPCRTAAFISNRHTCFFSQQRFFNRRFTVVGTRQLSGS